MNACLKSFYFGRNVTKNFLSVVFGSKGFIKINVTRSFCAQLKSICVLRRKCWICQYEFNTTSCQVICRHFTVESNNVLDQKKVVENLSKIQRKLQWSLKETRNFVETNNLFMLNVDDLIRKCNICEKAGFSKHIIKQNGWILTFTEGRFGCPLF